MSDIAKIQEQIKANDFDSIDLDSVSIDDLKSAALQEQPVVEEPKKRDDKGRFTKSEEETREADEDEQVIYRREIDLGDGSGVQIFEAPTPEELIDKLVTAQTNATRKIREQAAQLKEVKQQKELEKKADDEDEFILSQEMMSRPSDAVRKAFKKATGMDIAEFKTVADRVKAMEESQKAQADLEEQSKSANDFVKAHPEYVANQTNGNRLSRALNLLIAEAKNSNQKINYGTLLEKAYQDLSESGLLELKSEDATADEKTPTGADTSRIEKPEEVVTTQRQVRKSSSLANRSRNVTAQPSKEVSEDDLLDGMSIDEVKKWASQHMSR
jgi:hypothetical protein